MSSPTLKVQFRLPGWTFVSICIALCSCQFLRVSEQPDYGVARSTDKKVEVSLFGDTGRQRGWTINGAGSEVTGLFGPYLYLSACTGFACKSADSRDPDWDADGVSNQQDRCSNTPLGQIVHTGGNFEGCASGQVPDYALAEYLVSKGFDPAADYDFDGIANASDLCSNTSSGISLESGADRLGCAIGQLRDSDVLRGLGTVAH